LAAKPCVKYQRERHADKPPPAPPIRSHHHTPSRSTPAVPAPTIGLTRTAFFSASGFPFPVTRTVIRPPVARRLPAIRAPSVALARVTAKSRNSLPSLAHRELFGVHPFFFDWLLKKIASP